jgi:hypothetical protein
MYYTKNNTTGNNARIKCIKADGTALTPAIFNYPANNGGNFTWWGTADSDGYYALREGINTIYIDSSCELQISDGGNKKGNLIIGKLNLINKDKPLNSKLCYSENGEGTAYLQVLKDIQELDPNNKFYYNNIITNDIAIELNADDADDNLKNPHA